MPIVSNENIKYNKEEHFYHLTEKALSTLLGNSNLINIWVDAPNRLIKQGRLLKNKLDQSAYNEKPVRFRNKDIIEYNIFLNEMNEVETITKALVMIAELSDDIDWDKKIISDETKWFESILSPCRDSGIYFQGQICDEVPEDKYRVGY